MPRSSARADDAAARGRLRVRTEEFVAGGLEVKAISSAQGLLLGRGCHFRCSKERSEVTVTTFEAGTVVSEVG
ncbi:MAG: hypothetical protein DI536_35620 [Archangium gephyra]|uniref:Uncharacterized protein n=1 Tax=Archangium gephyra TaxID=48 RepID=A0A2W5SLB1_9BACT|nr:MAG: hypothetical protein DI536_35620 [Archangium gephyra]